MIPVLKTSKSGSLIFASMQKRPGIFFLLLFILTAIAGFSAKQVLPETVGVKKQAIVLKASQLPNAELERPQTFTSAFGQATEKRTISYSILATCPVLHTSFKFIKPAQTGKRGLPFKTYLFFIYPFHNFW